MSNKETTNYLYPDKKDFCKYCGNPVKIGRMEEHKKLMHGMI